jgi:hypothetical protein
MLAGVLRRRERLALAFALGASGCATLLGVDEPGGDDGGGDDTSLFEAAKSLTAGSDCLALASGRVSGDALPDLIVPDEGNLILYAGNGTGDFANIQELSLGMTVLAVEVADLNGDGLDDIVAFVYGAGYQLVVLRQGPGAGQFGTPETLTVDTDHARLAIGDLNNDDRPDVLLTGSGDLSGTATELAFLQEPSGAYADGVDLGLDVATVDAVIAEVTGDGVEDVIAGHSTGVSLHAQIPGSPGQFMPGQQLASGTTVRAVLVVDLTDDARADVVAGQDDAVLLIRQQDAPGSFSAAASTGASGARALASGDLDGDGLPDLAGITKTTPSVLLNDDAMLGHFTSGGGFDIGSDANDLVLVDFNNDQKLDVAACNRGSSNVTVALHR